MFLFSLSRSRSFVSSRNLSISEGEMIFFYEYRSFYEFVETYLFRIFSNTASRNRISNPFKRGRIIARIVLFFDYSSHNYLLSVFGWKKKERKRKALLTGRNLCSARCKGRSRSGVRVIEETIFLKEVRRVEKYILDGVLTSSKSDGDKNSLPSPILFKL